MPSRFVNFDHIEKITAENVEIGNGSVFTEIDEKLYKSAKERFVSDLNGGSSLEIIILISFLPLTYLSYNMLYLYIQLYHHKLSKIFFQNPCIKWCIEFIYIIISNLFIICN